MLAAPALTSAAACRPGIQRANGVRSATSLIYQTFLAGSQRAPNALTASFSANGVTRLILMGGLSRRHDAVPSWFNRPYARTLL